ncbi:Transcriptional regulator, LysR family [Leucobacter sp. 7(1)]|uniref:LysR family transcriptional regulator n=1 Tax=Leucobacter sp. 7(1) TaxID=1255613 RepID=UPI00097F4B1E|nr:LysR family transcriptional regulator [Leucobacter sp. 7(1)]SJN09072.1 Transcriptional regulator, LysR family [Leucobacter sp. 7(1)]
MRSPDLSDLRCFEAALRLGSLSAAARELGVTQQAVSARLRGLERLTGGPLVHRSPAGVTATPDGDAVLAWAREVLDAAARLDEGIASLAGGTRRTLRIGASQTIAAHRLPSWLLELRRAQLDRGMDPSDIALRTANSTEVVAAVRAGELDLGFIETPDAPPGLGSAVVGQDQMVVAIAPEHPWASLTSVPLAEIAATPLVTREAGSGTRAVLDTTIAAHVAHPAHQPALVLATEAAVRSAVAQGVAPAVLSELTVRDDVRLGRIVARPLGPEPLLRPFTAVWRGGPGDLSGTRRELVALAARGRADS